MFDLDGFVAQCGEAAATDEPRGAVKEVLERALEDRVGIMDALPATKAELTPIHSSDALTIMNVIWAPGMTIPPHNHHMWALIGIYGGEEVNHFYRRSGDTLDDSGDRHVVEGETLMLGEATIHAVSNPLSHSYTGAIHIYGGDFVNMERSLWDPQTLEEGPADGATMRRLFEAANS